MLDFFKTPVERPEAVVAAGKGNVADRGICSFQKMSAEIDPVLVYQIRKGKVQMAVDNLEIYIRLYPRWTARS